MTQKMPSLPNTGVACSPFGEIHRCSDAMEEPLLGSSKPGHTYVLLEHGDHWGHDILDGEAFGEELTAQFKTLPGLYLIRKVGRAGHGAKAERIVYLVFCNEGVVEQLTVTAPEDIMKLDLSGPGRNGAKRVDEPVLLVCTHAKRDMCCALKGRPMARELSQRFPDAHVWESSHTKGHRFAPSMVLFPHAYSFGRLNVEAASAMLIAAGAGELFLPGNRGRGTLTPRGQVAELAVAEVLRAERRTPLLGELEILSDAPNADGTHADVVVALPAPKREFRVRLAQRAVEGVVPSCGDQPKTAKVWVSESVEELNT